MPLIGSGVIGHGGAEAFDVMLAEGHTYAVAVQPTEPGVDFDLHIFDQNGNLVAQDNSYARDAYCGITPAWTGPFRMVVKSASGTSAYEIRVNE
jgi:hypothetical protein